MVRTRAAVEDGLFPGARRASPVPACAARRASARLQRPRKRVHL